MKSFQVSHAKPRFTGNDEPWPAASARVMQQHAGQAHKETSRTRD